MTGGRYRGRWIMDRPMAKLFCGGISATRRRGRKPRLNAVWACASAVLIIAAASFQQHMRNRTEKRVTRGRDFIAEAEINASRARREAVSRRSSNWLHPAAPLCICPNIRVCHDVSICLAAGSEMARLDSRMSDVTGLLHMVREMKTLTLHGAETFPQRHELLPGGMSCPSDQIHQQSNRRDEAVGSQVNIHSVTRW